MGREVLFGPITFTSRTVSLPTSAGTINGYGVAQTATVHIEPGQTYIVVWDETEWTVMAMDASSLVSGAVAMGNLKPLALPDTGEPFLIGEIDGTQMILCVDETEPAEHNITVYVKTEDAVDPSFEIVLKDRDGVSNVWPATVIRMLTNDGAIRKFVNEDSVAIPVEKTVEPDFSAGDMEVVPESGKVFSKVIVTQPETLVPENIAKDVVIGGVVGALAGGKGTTKEIVPDFSGGNQTVTAEEEELWNEIIFQKPDTLVAGNIKSGVNIAGIVGSLSTASYNVVVKQITGSTATSGTQTLITSSELSAIGFASASKRFMLMIPADPNVIPSQNSWKMLGLAFARYPYIVKNQSSLNGWTCWYTYFNLNGNVANWNDTLRSVHSSATNSPWTGSTTSNYPYYADGAIKYNLASDVHLCRGNGTGGAAYIVIAGCY